jgi:hypothetical protein
MDLQKRVIWLVQSSLTGAVYDAAVSLPEAKRRAVAHLEITPDDVKWIVLDSGYINGYSRSLDRVVVLIAPYHLAEFASLEEVLHYAEPGH